MDLIKPWGGQPCNLDNVQAQFEQWRNSREKRKAIPDELWGAAAALYPTYSLHQISKALRLNHAKLKQHVQGQSSDLTIPTAAAFFELGFDKPSPPSQCIVEMQNKNGAKMTMQATSDSLDLMNLARLFWSRP